MWDLFHSISYHHVNHMIVDSGNKYILFSYLLQQYKIKYYNNKILQQVDFKKNISSMEC